ncbi:MAG: hypothetical protein IKK58_00620 [Clostridia bacterium]|nr:hypothetical protein [Clostridia bacterium]
MSFYSYRQGSGDVCPGRINGDCTRGLTERVCIQVKKVYDSCIQQQQLDSVNVRITDICPCGVKFDAPITFVSCRSTTTKGRVRDLCIERLCDRPNFARVRCKVDIPVEILFCDSCSNEGKGNGVITVNKDVILFVPDESIIPFSIESIASAICVQGCYLCDNTFRLTVCVTVILKVVAEVELLVPTYGFCRIPPCEEFASEVCDEFFSLPLFPPELTSGCSCDCECDSVL